MRLSTLARMLLYALSLWLGMVSAQARELVVGGIPEEPVRYVDPRDGVIKGLDVDVLAHILTRLGVDYRIVLESSAARLENNWRQGKVYDMVFTYSFKDERTPYLLYAREAHIHNNWYFFALKENLGRWDYQHFADLKGLRVGATQGFSYTKEFWTAVEAGIWHTDLVTQPALQMQKLLHGRIDIVPLPAMVTLYGAHQGGYAERIGYLPKPIKSEAYFNTFVKGSTYPGLEMLAERYDEELRRMKQDGSLLAIYRRYGLEAHYPF
ncbi:transporter substrate-binding domain-containing protein [Pseudomonas sp. J452]|uniref:substrate-binding periplasmic protein n=1 Tax=Pseudomonas sp. J452 TaxID=2898441 RepID=UPI0021ADCB57|nr:transporter substrate-binding domain-containing protein [Pseudomonas sp. J452]UUY09251.1 transporter substrate-binding domain-containing protein [Pseudomonas sp. J452]